MKRDFSALLVSLGTQLVDRVEVMPGEFEHRPMTLGSVSVSVLLGAYPDEQGISGEEKFKRFQIAQRLSAGGTQEVTAEEVTLIKRLIGKGYAPMVVGPAYIALERDPDAAATDAS